MINSGWTQIFLHIWMALSAIFCVSAWSPSIVPPSLSINRSVMLFADRPDSEFIKNGSENDSTNTSFGVSYIGGDPCGSKYNTDPFDVSEEKSFKPGFPDDMKARIAALAAKKLEERKDDN